MCRVFGVSLSRYYAQLIPGGSKRQREDHRLLVSIKTSLDGSERTYGADCICRELREQGTNGNLSLCEGLGVSRGKNSV